MKNKKLFSLITVFVLLLAVLLSGCASGAWFKEGSENSSEFELVADGVLLIVIDVPSVVFEGEGSMMPAVLMENALREHKYFDVKKIYNSLDPQPSFVEKIAMDAIFNLKISFYTGGGTSGTYLKAVPIAFGAYVGKEDKKREVKEWEISIVGIFNIDNDKYDADGQKTIEDLGVNVKFDDNNVITWCLEADYVANGDSTVWTPLDSNTTIFKRDNVIQTALSSEYIKASGDRPYYHAGGMVMTTNDIIELKGITYLKMCNEEIATDLKNTQVEVQIALDGSPIVW